MSDKLEELVLAITDLLLDPDAWDRVDLEPLIKARDAVLAEREVNHECDYCKGTGLGRGGAPYCHVCGGSGRDD